MGLRAEEGGVSVFFGDFEKGPDWNLEKGGDESREKSEKHARRKSSGWGEVWGIGGRAQSFFLASSTRKIVGICWIFLWKMNWKMFGNEGNRKFFAVENWNEGKLFRLMYSGCECLLKKSGSGDERRLNVEEFELRLIWNNSSTIFVKKVDYERCERTRLQSLRRNLAEIDVKEFELWLFEGNRLVNVVKGIGLCLMLKRTGKQWWEWLKLSKLGYGVECNGSKSGWFWKWLDEEKEKW